MDASCYCDYDPPEAWSKSVHKARKPHRCEECSATILPGEQYEYVWGIWEGCASIFKTCLRCLAVREWGVISFPCLCWSHGNTLQDVHDLVTEEASGIPGLFIEYGRKMIAVRRHQRAHPWRKYAA